MWCQNKIELCYQATVTKNKWLDWLYIKMVDLRIWDLMDKMSLNEGLGALYVCFIRFNKDIFYDLLTTSY